jgi:hypothetical protein
MTDQDARYRQGYMDGFANACQAWCRLCRRLHWSCVRYVLRKHWWAKLRPWADKTTDEIEFPPEIEP